MKHWQCILLPTHLSVPTMALHSPYHSVMSCCSRVCAEPHLQLQFFPWISPALCTGVSAGALQCLSKWILFNSHAFALRSSNLPPSTCPYRNYYSMQVPEFWSNLFQLDFIAVVLHQNETTMLSHTYANIHVHGLQTLLYITMINTLMCPTAQLPQAQLPQPFGFVPVAPPAWNFSPGET